MLAARGGTARLAARGWRHAVVRHAVVRFAGARGLKEVGAHVGHSICGMP